jgi:Rieske Fe-S protein
MAEDVKRRTVLLGGLGAAGASAVAGCAKAADTRGPKDVVGKQIATTGEIPVGGGKIFSSDRIVVTQPVAGQFKAFNATCTHRGCEVARVSGGRIICPCHGSEFSVADGSVSHGPAQASLQAVGIRVQGQSIIVTAAAID